MVLFTKTEVLNMLSTNEKKVLTTIKQIDDEESKSKERISNFIFTSKIAKELNLEEYELNEIMRSLNEKGYICNIFNEDDKYIHGTKLTDKGKVELKHYVKNVAIYIFKQYVWVVITILITAILTAYFTSLFTR